MSTTIPKLTAASEKRIGDALHQVVDLVNDGMHPTDAITKIASEKRIPAGHVRLMVHAYNNGRTVSHLKTANDVVEKAAAFELADCKTILERMFPSEFKTATEKHIESVVSPDYNRSPHDWYNKRADQHAEPVDLKKEWALEKAADYPAQLRDRQALSKTRALKRDVEEAYNRTMKLAYDVAHAIDGVADYFKRTDSLPFSQVHENAKLVLGAPGDQLMAKVASENPQFARKQGAPHDVDWKSEPYSLIKRALQTFNDFTEARKVLDDLRKTADTTIEETLRPFVPVCRPGIITGSVWETPSPEPKQAMEKEAISPVSIGIGGMLSGGLSAAAKQLQGPTRDDRVQERISELSDVEHEQNLRAIQTQAMLQDLMANDPVIGGYDPAQVLAAYNQISQMAPRAASRQLMVQPLLRKYLEQGQAMDPFDIDQMLDAEKKLHNVGIAQEPDNQPKLRPDVDKVNPHA